MERPATDISNATQLAKKLEVEIHRRHLLPGDRFMTAVEAGQVLGVSRATADRAMGVLARREILERRRALGTFVGPNARNTAKTKTRTVYVLFPDIFIAHNIQLHTGRMMDGIREHLANTNIQFCFFPQENTLAHVRQLLEPANLDGTLAGVVAISCPEEVYEYLSRAGMPTVVLGSLYQDGAQLASIDQDNRQAGRLLTKHLLDRGHRRMALVVAVDGRPGDHDFFDGISEALSEAGLPHNALMVRVVNPRNNAAYLAIGNILGSCEPATGIIVRHKHFAETIEAAAAERGLAIPSDIEIVCHVLSPEDSYRYTCVQSTISEDEIATLIGELLDGQNKGKAVEPKKTVIPVEICVREEDRAQGTDDRGK